MPTEESKIWMTRESWTVLVAQKPGESLPRSHNNKDCEDPISQTRNTEEGEDQLLSLLSKQISENQDGSEMKRYCSVYKLDYRSGVALFTHRSYKMAITEEFTSTEMRSTNCVLDNGAGPDLMREDADSDAWL